jgi:hypothetical protein
MGILGSGSSIPLRCIFLHNLLKKCTCIPFGGVLCMQATDVAVPCSAVLSPTSKERKALARQISNAYAYSPVLLLAHFVGSGISDPHWKRAACQIKLIRLRPAQPLNFALIRWMTVDMHLHYLKIHPQYCAAEHRLIYLQRPYKPASRTCSYRLIIWHSCIISPPRRRGTGASSSRRLTSHPPTGRFESLGGNVCNLAKEGVQLAAHL